MTTLINDKEYREDARGNLIPVSAIKPVDLMRDEKDKLCQDAIQD